jgi:predicted dehydrogenase
MREHHSRRNFLKRGTLATAAAAMLPAFASADDGSGDADAVPVAQARAALGPGEPVRIGVIGTGGMGTGHVQSFVQMASRGQANVKVDALCDVCQPRLAAAKAIVEKTQGGEVATYARHRDLLARRDLHGVLIASPEHSHARLAEDAIKAGKDVYLEKPMTLTLDDAQRLRDVMRKNPDMRLVVGTQFVMSPAYIAAEQLVREGAIGKPVWSQTSYCRNSRTGEWMYYEIDKAWEPGVNLDWNTWCEPLRRAPWNPEIYARWRRYRRYSSGIIGDLLVHHMAPHIKALGVGWPIRVVASGGHYVDTAMENHDQVNLNVEFEGGHTMVVAGSTANELGLERIIRGHKGNLYIAGRTATIRPERIWADDIEEREIAPPPGPAIDDQNALRLHWLDIIRTRGDSASDVELGTKVMVIVDLARRSLWEGGAYGYDPRRRRVRRL